MMPSSVSRAWSRPVFRAFRATASARIGVLIVLGLVVVAVLAPGQLSDRATEQRFDRVTEGPSAEFLLGTDQLGRDILAQLLVATRLSLEIALASSVVALVVGVVLGGSTALAKGVVRTVLLRVIDTLISFPALLITIFFAVILGAGTTGVLLGVGLAFSFPFARLVSNLAMSIGGREYINAARLVGVSRGRLLRRYLMANIAEPLVISFSVMISGAILSVSALSFLGLGVQAPEYDWGRLLSEGLPQIYQTPAAALGPAAFIVLASIGFGLSGEALARALNPVLWTSGRTSERRAGVRRPRQADLQTADVGITHACAEDPAGQVVTKDAALVVRQLSVSFPGADGPVEVVKSVSFAVRPGEFVGIVGESGSGKSMTMLSAAQLTPFPGRVRGEVWVHGRRLGDLGKRELDHLLGTELAVVFQDPSSSLNPALPVGAQLTEGVRVHRRLTAREASEKAARGLAEMHIPAAVRQLARFPHEFSGGMRQRVMIAKGLIREPSILIADEPTTALDVTVQAQIMEVLHEVNRERGTAIVFISHNLALVSQNCQRVIVMYAGRVVEELDGATLAEEARHPYTRALLAAVPSFGDVPDDVAGPVSPEPIGPPDLETGGCAYAARCPLVTDRCREVVPALLDHPDRRGRSVACHVVNADLSPSRS